MYFDLLEECALDENNETALPTRHTLSALVRQPEESSKAQTQMQAYRGLAGWNAMRQASIIHMGIFPQGTYGTAKITCFNEKWGRALAQSKAGNQSPSTCIELRELPLMSCQHVVAMKTNVEHKSYGKTSYGTKIEKYVILARLCSV